MVTMAQIAHSVLTNIDPAIKILGPNITLGGLGWLEQFIQAGGPLPDIVTFHDYMESQPETSLGEIVGLRDMLAHYPQWSALPIWCTGHFMAVDRFRFRAGSNPPSRPR